MERPMSKIVVANHLTLDGVMQSPARSDEDTRDGFTHGGWASATIRGGDLEIPRLMGEGMGQVGAYLFGRRTYEDFYRVWGNRTDNPFSEAFNNTQKYVASTTLTEPLPWRNSALLAGDAAEAVERLKGQSEKNIVIFGSGDLIQSLMSRNLIDRYILMIHPLILGTGHRLFTDGGAFSRLRLASTVATTTGVVIATYDSDSI
jgi:dihydrofolate reductase